MTFIKSIGETSWQLWLVFAAWFGFLLLMSIIQTHVIFWIIWDSIATLGFVFCAGVSFGLKYKDKE